MITAKATDFGQVLAENWAGFAWLFVLLAVNAFFVGAEFAVLAARRSQIEPLAERGKRSARTALWAMENATLMLAMAQLGITVSSLLILNVSEPAIHHLLEVPLGLTGWSTEVIAVISFVTALILVTFLHVVFGEMVPKNLSFSIPDRAVLILAPPLVLTARIFRPVIWALNSVANGALRLVGVTPKSEATSTYTLEQVESIVSHSTREGVLSDVSGALTGTFEFTAKKVADVAISMDDIETLPDSATPGDVEQLVAQRGFSRYVLVDHSGEPTGYVHVKDVLDLRDDELNRKIPAKRIRTMTSVYAGSDLEDALALMRRNDAHLVRCVDADGNTIGVLYLEDVLEVLVGEVRDSTRRR